MTKPNPKSALSDKRALGRSQAESSDNDIGNRIIRLLGGRSQTWLSRETGISPSTLSDYMRGKVPRADKAVEIAKALGTSVEFLFGGTASNAIGPPLFEVSEADWAVLPLYDLLAFTHDTKPEPIGSIPLPRPWLGSVTGPVERLWLTTVTATVGEWLREGEKIVCCDVDGDIVDGRLYIFMIDDRPIIRRVAIVPHGYQLSSGDPLIAPLLINGDFVNQGIYPVARIAAAFRFAPF